MEVVHESTDGVLVLLNRAGNELTFCDLVDTRYISPWDKDEIARALKSEVHSYEDTYITLNPQGYALIYRPNMAIKVLRNIEATIASILEDLTPAA